MTKSSHDKTQADFMIIDARLDVFQFPNTGCESDFQGK
jgi:hypothetical protein